MSVTRTVPAARQKTGVSTAVLLAAIVAAYFVGKRVGAAQELIAASPSNAQKIALVKKQKCATGWCETLWLGNTRADAAKVAELAAGSEHCDEIAWASDGYRVGFVVNGYQLRIFDGVGRTPINRVNLIEPDGHPTSHLARGITFSQNGAAVTFDECPRGRSGCKSGMAAVR
jgi:hypothetical protein